MELDIRKMIAFITFLLTKNNVSKEDLFSQTKSVRCGAPPKVLLWDLYFF